MSKRDRQLKQRLEELFSSEREPEAIEAEAQPAPPMPVSVPEAATAARPADLDQLKTVLDSIPLPVYIKDREHRWVAANFAFGQMIGQPASVLIGHSDKEQADEEWQQDDQVLDSGQPADAQTATTLSDGSLQTRRVRRTPLFNAAHEVEYVMGVTQEVITPSQTQSIAERKQAQEELLKFKLGIERSTAAVFITDKNGQIQYVNPAFETVYGYTRAEAIGKTPRILKSGLISPEGYKQFWNTLLSKNTVSGEIINKAKDGHLVPIDGSNNPILDENGNLIGFLAIHHDISQRKHTEEVLAKHAADLEESMTLLDAVLENLPAGLFMKDAQALRFVRWNKGNEELIGLKREEVIGKTDFDFFPPDEAAFFTSKDREVLNNGQLVDIPEEPIDTGHHGRRLLHTRKVPLFGADGTPKYLLGISEDITERKRTEAALEQSAQMLRTIADTVPDLIYIKNSRSEFLMANQSVARLIGVDSPDALLGKTDFDFFPRELAEKYYADEQAVIRSGKPVLDTEEKTVDPDGREHWLSTTKVPFRAPDGSIEGIVGVGRDITERKRAEVEREQLLAAEARRALQLQTAAAISNAASTVLDIDELLPFVVNLIQQRFSLYYVGLFLVDAEPRYAVLRSGTGDAGRMMLERGHRLPIDDHSMIGWCIGHQEARIALDVGAEAVRFENPLLPETRSELALPLISRGQVLGAMTVQSKVVAAFSQQDISALQTMADQVANAIANAQLFNQTQVARGEAEARLHEVQFLQRVGQEASMSLDLSHTLDVIFQTLEKDMGFTHVAISLIDRAAGVVTIPRAAGTAAGMQGLTRSIAELQNDILMDIARKGKIEVIDGWDDRFDRAIWEREGHAALVRAYVPLLLQGEAVGILEVGYRHTERARITPDEVRLLDGVAGQIAIAIANARLFEEARLRADELAGVNELSKALAAQLNVDQVLNEAVRGVARLLDTRNLYIGLYDPERNEVTFPVNMTESPIDQEIVAMPANEGLTGHVIRTKMPLLIRYGVGAWRASMGMEAVGEDAQSWLGVPLLIGDQVLGVIAIQSFTSERTYNERDRELLVSIANQTAVALQNARLFERTQHDAERERTINRIATRIRNAQSVEQVLTIAAEELRAATQSGLGVAEIAPIEQVPEPSSNGDRLRSAA